ncbi:MAG: cell division protein ZapA [Betaproteobacteria bacterium]
MKQLEVQIMGQSYLLGCPDGGEAQLLQAVQRVDAAMCKIRDAGKVRARDRIAVLAALNLAFDVAATGDLDTDLGVDNSRNLTLTRRQSDGVLEPLIKRIDKVLANDGLLF